MATNYPRQKPLSLGLQHLRMRTQHPQFRGDIHRGTTAWTGEIQPTAMSAKYTVRICYKLSDQPRVTVLNPRLRDRGDGQPVPHMYSGEALCLHHPLYGEWKPTLFIADTIIPWAALWLYYYEVWHVTGEWLGGGEHPAPRSN
jgi:hypothetical protein